jgi:methionyl-tRNA synthetase
MSTRFYITTPIYYPNAEPHLGHVYTTLAADVLARYHRLIGDETFFLTGTDEHGIKMVKTAADQKIEPRELADRVVAVFEQLWKELNVTHDDFIRTTSDRHKLAVQKIVEKLQANGDIYLGEYSGWYDEGQEEFVTETEAKVAEFKSAISGRPLVRYAEKSYFFRLTKYAPRVLQYIEDHPHFIQPESRRNEVVSKLKAGVEDLSISRATLKWGIPMPHDPAHVVYVWIDALSNYITAIGYGSSDESLLQKFWPADVHLIGKEILWFHTVYWPAMLMGLELPLPKCVFAHGWWTSEGRKMSKTMGNFVDLEKLHGVIKDYSLDALRFYLLRAAPFGSDLDWSDGDFNKSFNELANVVGNCLNRTVKMIGRYRGGKLPAIGAGEDIDKHLIEQTSALPQKLGDAYARLELQHALTLPVELARATNGYIDATEPFKLAKDPAKASRLDTVLNLSAQAIYRALVALLPVLPEKASAGLKQLGVDVTGQHLPNLFGRQLEVGAQLGEGQPLFPKIDEKPKK